MLLPRRFQFTVRGLIRATLLVAMAAATWRYGVELSHITPDFSRRVVLLLLFFAPLPVLMAIFGRRSLPGAVAWIVWVVVLLLVSIVFDWN